MVAIAFPVTLLHMMCMECASDMHCMFHVYQSSLCMREGLLAPAKIMVPLAHTVPEFLIFQTFKSCSTLLESQWLIYLIIHIIMHTMYFIQIINITKYLIITMNSKFLQDEYPTADE